MKEEIEINDGEASKVFKALASETRWKILKMLVKAKITGKKLDVTRIAEALKQQSYSGVPIPKIGGKVITKSQLKIGSLPKQPNL